VFISDILYPFLLLLNFGIRVLGLRTNFQKHNKQRRRKEGKMKLFDYLEEYERQLEFQIMELEKKNQRLRESNDLLRQYHYISDNELDKRVSVDHSKQENGRGIEILQDQIAEESKEEDQLVSLPCRLDEILKLAKSTRATTAEKKEKLKAEAKTAPVAKTKDKHVITASSTKQEKSGRNPLPLRAFVQKDQNQQLQSQQLTASDLPRQPVESVIPKRNIYAEFKEEINGQLQVLGKIRIFSRFKSFFQPNEKLQQSRSALLSSCQSDLDSSCDCNSLIYKTLRQFHSFPSYFNRQRSEKELISEEMNRLIKRYNSSNSVKYLTHKVSKPTIEMMEELFLIWYSARNIQEWINRCSETDLKRNKHSKKTDHDDNDDIISQISLQLYKPFLYPSYYQNLSQYQDVLQQQVNEKLRWNSSNKKSQKQANNNNPFSSATNPLDIWKIFVSNKIDRHYQQILYLLQYFIEKNMSKKLIVFNEMLKKLIQDQEKEKALSGPKTINENQWIYILKIFRCLHTILVSHGNRSNCIFLHQLDS
jgi:hypothetical protein